MNRTKIISILTLLFGVLLVGRWFYYIDQYSVNLLFWDQWDFYKPLFEDASVWGQFNYQHGPHRQGIGMWLTAIVAHLSDWNTRAETFTIGALILCATLLSVQLKDKLFGKIKSTDIALLLIGLAPTQYALFSATPNVSHGSMPFLLIVLYGLAWTVKGDLKYLWVSALNFLLIYTGFGIFAGFITPVLFILEIARDKTRVSTKWIIWLFFGLSLFSLGLFFSDYTPNKHGAQVLEQSIGFKDYLAFIFQSISNYWSFKAINGFTYFLGGVSFLGLLFLVFQSLLKLWKNPTDDKYRIIFIMASFTLLFLVGAAAARVSGGIATSKASRYAIYLSPGFIACYFYIQAKAKNRWMPLLFCGLLLLPTLNVRQAEREMERMSRNKLKWKEVYLQTQNIEQANAESNFRVLPKKKEDQLKKRLEFLKKNRLNLYNTP
jgi:hypothetical protein